jgi:hypothetical protein
MWQLVYSLSFFFAIFIIKSFLEALNYHVVRPFDLALGCATETYLTSMHAFSQNSQNWLAVKFDPRSVMMVFGKPKRCKIS